MIWAMKEIENTEGAKVFDRFEPLFFALNAPRGMLLVSSEDSNTYYISLAESGLLSSFPGFREISTAELPEVAILLIGSQTDFEERFRFPRP